MEGSSDGAGSSDVKTTTSLKITEKLEKARMYKQKGNDFFKQQQLKKAIQSYHSGLLYMKGINHDFLPSTNKILDPMAATRAPVVVSEEDKIHVQQLTADLQNNLAACLLKQDPVKYERVVDCCKQVTELTPTNTKGWYRLGLAYYHLRNFQESKTALMTANKLSNGQDMAVRRLLATVEQEVKKEDEKFNNMFKNRLL